MITEEEYKELKELYIENIKELILDQGGLYPHLTVFADHRKQKENQKPAIIHIPIDGEYIESEESKDEFVNETLPLVYNTIKEDFIPHAMAWATEAWLRIADKDFDIKKQDWKNLPVKKEVLLISIETADSYESYMYEIKRHGSQINSDGKLTDRLELFEMEKMEAPIGGRFVGLYKKLNK